MKKRGQVLGTPFIMIFALVVGALILIGGLYYVYKLTTTAKEISIIKEINDFKTKVQAYYYLEEGNTRRTKISLPTEAKNICFYDSEKTWNPMTLSGATGRDYPADFAAKETYYKNFFKAFKTRNLFIFPKEKLKESSFAIPNLNLESQNNNPICIMNGREVRIISMGDHVEIEYIPPGM